MRGIHVAAAALCAWIVLATSGHAQADEPANTMRVVLDSATVEPSTLPGLARVNLAVSALDLNGQVVDVSGKKTWKLTVGSGEKHAPYVAGTFTGTGHPLALVIVLETAGEYQDDFETIKNALTTSLLSKLPEHSEVAIIGYSDAVHDTGKLSTAKAASNHVNSLSTDPISGAPALLDAVERGLGVLKKAKSELDGQSIRRLLIIIGDGRDRDGDHERASRLGQRAGKDGIRIHTLGFSPTDVRRPLLTLGELSKQSMGTFRWVRTRGAQSFIDQFERLRDEINRQYALTFFVPAEDVVGKKAHVGAMIVDRDVVSNDLKLPPARCGGDACPDPDAYCAVTKCSTRKIEHRSGGLFRTLLWIVGGAVALIVLLGVIGMLMTKHGKRSAPVAVGPSLQILTGTRTGERIALRHGLTVGKAPTCDLVIDDGYASTNHAQFVADTGGNWTVNDRGSTNGTFVNGVRITEARVTAGSTIRIGNTDLRFVDAPPAQVS